MKMTTFKNNNQTIYDYSRMKSIIYYKILKNPNPKNVHV